MKLALQKNHSGGQILYTSPDPVKNGVFVFFRVHWLWPSTQNSFRPSGSNTPNKSPKLVTNFIWPKLAWRPKFRILIWTNRTGPIWIFTRPIGLAFYGQKRSKDAVFLAAKGLLYKIWPQKLFFRRLASYHFKALEIREHSSFFYYWRNFHLNQPWNSEL